MSVLYICQTLTYSIITIRTMSIIVHPLSTLRRLLVVVRTGIYNTTACILATVLIIILHLPSEGMCGKLSMYHGIALIILQLNVTMIWGSGFEVEQINYKVPYFTPYYHRPSFVMI